MASGRSCISDNAEPGHTGLAPQSGHVSNSPRGPKVTSGWRDPPGGPIAQNAVPGQCKRSPHHAKWAGGGELYAEREDRFWKPVSPACAVVQAQVAPLPTEPNNLR